MDGRSVYRSEGSKMAIINITENIYCFDKDCCRVYIIRNGADAVLIDFGSGGVLEELPAMGITTIHAVYITVPQRNHCQGLSRLPPGVPVYYPAGTEEILERFAVKPGNPVRFSLFPGVYEIPSSLNNPGSPPPKIQFGDYVISPLRIGGFMECQTAYFADSVNERICFSGDAIYAPGKIYAAYNFEHMHHTGTGQSRGVEALRLLRMARPDMLCPAHGEVMRGNTFEALTLTMDRLNQLAQFYETNCPEVPASHRIPCTKGCFQQVSEHIWMRGNIYVVISEAKKALLIDFYEQDDEHVRQFLKEFEACFPGTAIERILISHFHFDHWVGINELRKYADFEVICSNYLKPALENPPAFKRPFQYFPGIKVDCGYADNETFKWHEYTFGVFEFPGQTDLHAGYFAVIDSRKVFFSGDNFYPAQQWGGTGGFSSFNGGDPENGWRRSIKLLLRLEPEWVLASHMHPFMFRRADFERRLDWTYEIVDAMKEIAADDHYQLTFNQHIFKVFPYSQPAAESFSVEFTVMNPAKTIAVLEVTPVTPHGVEAVKQSAEITVPPSGRKSVNFDFKADKSVMKSGGMITFDITRNREYLGQKTECFIY